MFCLYPCVWFTTCFALCDDIFDVSMLSFFFPQTFACLGATCYILVVVCNLWHISSLSLRVIYDMLCFMWWYFLCLYWCYHCFVCLCMSSSMGFMDPLKGFCLLTCLFRSIIQSNRFMDNTQTYIGPTTPHYFLCFVVWFVLLFALSYGEC